MESIRTLQRVVGARRTRLKCIGTERNFSTPWPAKKRESMQGFRRCNRFNVKAFLKSLSRGYKYEKMWTYVRRLRENSASYGEKLDGKKGRECCEVYPKILTFFWRRFLREFATLLRNVTLVTRKPLSLRETYDGKSWSDFDFGPSDILCFILERIWRRIDLHVDLQGKCKRPQRISRWNFACWTSSS